ncbi:MAG: PilZ domain-containing protein [Spirochaetota bacterium]|nr:MAG: PilZ domain-containing protein [Spirochaetota bacterium]
MRIILIVVAVIVVIGIVVWRFRGGKNRFPWYEFFSRGRKEGFSLREIRFLKKIAIENKLEKPQSIYWSTRQLDRCLRPALRKINADVNLSQEEKLTWTEKLLELRTKAEFNLPKYQKRIRDTNALLPRQKLVIRERSYGTFASWVVEVNRRVLVVTQPSGQKGWEALNWTGKKVSVFFWREDDAGYTLETKVQQQITHEEYPLMYLEHSNKLRRTQKRKSVRIDTKLRANFYPVGVSSSGGTSKAYVSKKKHVARIIDLSETGCAMLAGSGIKKNDRVKLDFNLTDTKRIVALGNIVNVSNTNDDRVKKYHLMFQKIGPFSKNNILLYVYNIFGEREEIEERKKRVSVQPVKKD